MTTKRDISPQEILDSLKIAWKDELLPPDEYMLVEIEKALAEDKELSSRIKEADLPLKEASKLNASIPLTGYEPLPPLYGYYHTSFLPW